MNFKKTNADLSTKTRNFIDFEGETDNIYESISIISKRANQIGNQIKEELSRKLEDFASYTDNLEEVFENREQIEISKFYERLSKPTLIAIDEFLNDKIYYRRPDNSGITSSVKKESEEE